MSESSEEHADPAWPHPASAAARATQRWADLPVDEYPAPADGVGEWADPDVPAVVPPPIAGVDGPHTRPGWLMRGRDGGGDGAA